jgi:predicted N-acetyltransferase YhbS
MPPASKVNPELIEIVPIHTVDAAAVELLLDHAFGTDRHVRTAYKVRGAGRPIAALSFAAIEDGQLIGSIQCWPVSLAGPDGGTVPLVMVGPVAVAPERQRDGIGRDLMAHMLAAAGREKLDGAMMLIGDPEYYGRFFGFSADRTGGWRLPGPVERHRLLARGGDVPGGEGMLGPGLVLAA